MFSIFFALPRVFGTGQHLFLYYLYKWAGHVARMGDGTGAYRILVRRPEGRRPIGRPRHMWEDNIKMDLQVVGWEGMDWIELAQEGAGGGLL
jgi:hypothetical protein